MCIIMEYCDLGDLNQFFKTYSEYCKQLPVKFQLMKQIITGIAFLHRSGVVHKDIKPGNILLKSTTPCGQITVKLGDFGLSKFLDPNSNRSSMSSDVGTFIFKAPEFFDSTKAMESGITKMSMCILQAAHLQPSSKTV